MTSDFHHKYTGSTQPTTTTRTRISVAKQCVCYVRSHLTTSLSEPNPGTPSLLKNCGSLIEGVPDKECWGAAEGFCHTQLTSAIFLPLLMRDFMQNTIQLRQAFFLRPPHTILYIACPIFFPSKLQGPFSQSFGNLLVFSRSHENGCTIRRTGEAPFSQSFGRSHSPNRIPYFFSKLHKWIIPHPLLIWRDSTKPLYLWSTHYPVSFREQLQYERNNNDSRFRR